MINKNIIAFIKGGILVNSKISTCPKDFSILDRPILGSIIKELQSIGYTLCPEVIWSISDDEIISIWEDIKPEIINLLGISDWSPLFPGFPDQVINLSEEEFLTEQLRVYFDSSYIDKLQEKYKVDKISSETSSSSLTPLKAITEKEFSSIFTRIVGVNDSITSQDKDILDWYLDNYSDLILPEKIPFKENLAIVLSKRQEAISVVSSINDILRVAVWKSGGDPSLPKIPYKMIRESSWTTKRIENPEREKFKFSHFSRKERNYILGLIDKYVSTKGIYPCICDAKTYSGRWLRLGEILHPGEYKKYPNSMKFFDELRNNAGAYQTWWSKIHKEYKLSKNNGGSLNKVIELISQRPGVLIRRFDSLLRRTWKNNVQGDIDLLLDKFLNAAGMNNKTLLEFYNYLDRRTKTSSSPRMIKIKGTRKRITLPSLEPLDDIIVETVKDLVKKKIFNNYQQIKESLEGKNIVIDDNIKYLRIPKDMRTLSDSKVVIPKGSKFKFELEHRLKTLRFFCHWIQEESQEDLDLHAYLLSEDFKKECMIGWNTSSKNSGEVYAAFSGDVLNRPGNCAEYIDLRPKIAVENGFRWCVIDVHNFKGRGFNSLKNWIGYTEVQEPISEDRQWYPKDVIQSIQPSTMTSGLAAFLIDLEEQTVQFLDEDISSIPINSECRSKNQAIINWYAHTPELGVYELLKLNILARKGEIKTQSEYEEAQFMDEFKSSDWIIYKYQDFISDYTKMLELLV